MRLGNQKLLRVWYASVVWAGLCIGPFASQAKAQESSEVVSLLHRIADVVVAGALEAPDVWGGFPGAEEYVLCGPTGTTLFVLSDPPPAHLGAHPLRASSDGRRVLYVAGEVPAELGESCFRFDYEIGTKKVLSFPQLDSLYSIRDPVLSSAAALHHEEFHRYQRVAFAETRGPSRLAALELPAIAPIEVVASEGFEALAQRERELLASILLARTVNPDSLATYWDVRRERYRMLEQQHIEAEEHLERHEASAQFVGYQLGLHGVDGNADRLTDLLVADLRLTPPFAAESSRRSAYRHWHIYATGAALAEVFRRIGMEWQAGLAKGCTFAQLLPDALAVLSGPKIEDSAGACESHGG